MREIIIVSILILAVPIAFFLPPFLKKSRRNKIKSEKFPDKWKQILSEGIEIYDYIPDLLKKKLHQDILIFLAEKNFVGCNGLKITDEIKVITAAQACMLFINRKSTYFPKMKTVLMYPAAYKAKGVNNNISKDQVRLGESWQNGDIVLSWTSVKRGGEEFDDGHNVVIHEFAHQIDQETGAANGMPVLDKDISYEKWISTLQNDFNKLVEDTKNHEISVMDKYGATNPAEFFAVATETFFEKPNQLYKNHKNLYDELKQYYKIDPKSWKGNGYNN